MTRSNRRRRTKKNRHGKSRQHVDAGKQRHERRHQTLLRKCWWKLKDAFCRVHPNRERWR